MQFSQTVNVLLAASLCFVGRTRVAFWWNKIFPQDNDSGNWLVK